MFKNLFSFDSKLTNVLGFVADIFIMNVLYLFTCLPILTIGAAQAGLYTAMRVLQDPADDSSVLKAYFRGFKSGFFKISLVHTVFFIFDAMLIYTIWVSYVNRDAGLFVHWAFPTVILCMCGVVHALLPAFHSQFNCKPFHLFRNCVLLFISHPLRSLGVGLLTWAPMIIYFWDGNVFYHASAAFFVAYFSVAFLFNIIFLQKPFKLLMEDADPDEVIEEIK